ncbi:ArsR family transcriptional regulator [Leisingera sp. ANG-M1]|uniref:ArsR/SmtB family transcription factor n=1 Tax=Leisingera sp. ANG-M1 TaxID=1577895 RepID=UPI00057E9B6C|nr:helix-turn-helix transcriptional regulator [Leisingera sp. ANG-M1]KIC12624.1 ArsR family transcriptional regulator [Leisingera sp. ANG-M1]
MEWEEAAQGFAAMGSEARLQVLRCLIRAGGAGLTVGEIQSRTGIAPSTLAHHLKFLTGAGVVEQERIGRSTISCADFTRLEALAGFILNECCADAAGKAANDG